MAMFFNKDNEKKSVTDCFINVDGAKRNVVSIFGNVNGEKKLLWTNAILNMFLATIPYSGILWSRDAKKWNKVDLSKNYNINCIAYGNSMYLIGCNIYKPGTSSNQYSTMFYSKDGKNWKETREKYKSPGYEVRDIFFSEYDGYFYLCGEKRKISGSSYSYMSFISRTKDCINFEDKEIRFYNDYYGSYTKLNKIITIGSKIYVMGYREGITSYIGCYANSFEDNFTLEQYNDVSYIDMKGGSYLLKALNDGNKDIILRDAYVERVESGRTIRENVILKNDTNMSITSFVESKSNNVRFTFDTTAGKNRKLFAFEDDGKVLLFISDDDKVRSFISNDYCANFTEAQQKTDYSIISMYKFNNEIYAIRMLKSNSTYVISKLVNYSQMNFEYQDISLISLITKDSILNIQGGE